MPGGTRRDPSLLGRQLWEPRSVAQGQEALNMGLLGQEACPLLRRTPPAMFSSLPTRPGPPQSRDQAPTPVWSCSHVQSWHAWVCVYFCSQECPEQEPAFVDSSVVSEGFPGGASGKKPACQCRRHKKCRFDPWVRKLPWRRALHPTAVFLPGESHGQRSLAGYSPWGHTESDTTEAT